MTIRPVRADRLEKLKTELSAVRRELLKRQTQACDARAELKATQCELEELTDAQAAAELEGNQVKFEIAKVIETREKVSSLETRVKVAHGLWRVRAEEEHKILSQLKNEEKTIATVEIANLEKRIATLEGKLAKVKQDHVALCLKKQRLSAESIETKTQISCPFGVLAGTPRSIRENLTTSDTIDRDGLEELLQSWENGVEVVTKGGKGLGKRVSAETVFPSDVRIIFGRQTGEIFEALIFEALSSNGQPAPSGITHRKHLFDEREFWTSLYQSHNGDRSLKDVSCKELLRRLAAVQKAEIPSAKTLGRMNEVQIDRFNTKMAKVAKEFQCTVSELHEWRASLPKITS